MEKGIRVARPKGGVFVWQHAGMLQMLKNRAYVGDLVQGVYECRKIRDDRRMTDPKKWIITENHHEPIIDRETFDKVQTRFTKTGRKWKQKQKDHHVLVGRVTCGCCGRNLRHSQSEGLIDESDYYLLIVAGKYGSIDRETGLGYTEKEFRYALEKEIPVIAFLHKDIGKLTVDKCEDTELCQHCCHKFEGRQRL